MQFSNIQFHENSSTDFELFRVHLRTDRGTELNQWALRGVAKASKKKKGNNKFNTLISRLCMYRLICISWLLPLFIESRRCVTVSEIRLYTCTDISVFIYVIHNFLFKTLGWNTYLRIQRCLSWLVCVASLKLIWIVLFEAQSNIGRYIRPSLRMWLQCHSSWGINGKHSNYEVKNLHKA
jgi:hypothetical protein